MFDDQKFKTNVPAEPEDIFAATDKGTVSPAPPLNMANRPSGGLPPMAAPIKSKNTRFVIAIIVVAVVIIAVGGYLFFKAWRMSGINNAPAVLNNNAEDINTEVVNQDLNKNLNLSSVENENKNINLGNSVSDTNNKDIQSSDGADSDLDGLTDEEEANIGTNPNKVDTDEDGLLDREEVRLYHTNPLNPDSDGDGFKDGEEVKSGYDPNGPGKLINLPQ